MFEIQNVLYIILCFQYNLLIDLNDFSVNNLVLNIIVWGWGGGGGFNVKMGVLIIVELKIYFKVLC